MSKPINRLIIKGESRTKRKHKEIYGPVGGTMAGFFKRAEANLGFKRSKRRPVIKIIDKT